MALPALIVQVQPQQRPQVRAPPRSRPVHPAGEQARLIQLEPVEAYDVLEHIIARLHQHPPPVPVQVIADHELIIHVAAGSIAGADATPSQGPPHELIAFALETQVAARYGCDGRAVQARDPLRTPAEVHPATWLPEREQMNLDADVRGLGRLELQQQLSPYVVGLVVEEFLQIQHVRSQPRCTHRRYDGAHAPLRTQTPG